jgi:hypothetical protein
MTQDQKEDITVETATEIELIIDKYELLPTKSTRLALMEAFQLGIDVMHRGSK